jgi:hypothetical protein
MATSKIPLIETAQPVLISARARLNSHSANNIFLGTSSWSFPGWSMVFAKEYRESQLAKAGLKACAEPPLFNANPLMRRWTLRQGMTYQSAREQFSPFTKIHFEDNQTMATLAHRIRAQRAIKSLHECRKLLTKF